MVIFLIDMLEMLHVLFFQTPYQVCVCVWVMLNIQKFKLQGETAHNESTELKLKGKKNTLRF